MFTTVNYPGQRATVKKGLYAWSLNASRQQGRMATTHHLPQELVGLITLSGAHTALPPDGMSVLDHKTTLADLGLPSARGQ